MNNELDEICISVIMPMRNVPSTILTKCIDSIVNQTFKKYELICIDDCSDSIDILSFFDKYNFDNFLLIRNDNVLGAANSRNIGLKCAKCDYVIFLDADDIFAPNMFESLYAEIIDKDSDMVVCGYTDFSQDGNNILLGDIHMPDMSVFINKSDVRWLSSILCVPWNRLCKRSFLVSENISFQSLSSGNDIYFNFMTAFCASKISVVSKSLILYRCGSLFQISSSRNPINYLLAVEKVKNDISSKECYKDEYLAMLNYSLLLLVIYDFSKKLKDDIKEEAYLIFRDYFKNSNIIVNNNYFKKKMIQFNNCDYTWIELVNKFELQFDMHSKELVSKLKQYTGRIVLWGIGERGKAFVSWCNKHNIKVDKIYDRSQISIGDIEGCNFDYLKSYEDLIAASNDSIFDIAMKECIKGHIINLESYSEY